jgi:hypothetical protein
MDGRRQRLGAEGQAESRQPSRALGTRQRRQPGPWSPADIPGNFPRAREDPKLFLKKPIFGKVAVTDIACGGRDRGRKASLSWGG